MRTSIKPWHRLKGNYAVTKAHMKYKRNVKQPGVARFLVDEHINLNEFRSLMMALAAALSSRAEWTSIPEAEIGKIKLSAGEIYAKLDFEYGLEIHCDGVMDHVVSQIEATLSKK